MGTELPLVAVLEVLRGAAFTLFFIVAFVLMVIILLQEGKGGGLAGAFGGAGAETFGVKAGTVNKLTAWIATAFLGLALIHAGLTSAALGRDPSKTDVTLPTNVEGAANPDETDKDGAAKDESGTKDPDGK